MSRCHSCVDSIMHLLNLFLIQKYCITAKNVSTVKTLPYVNRNCHLCSFITVALLAGTQQAKGACMSPTAPAHMLSAASNS